jgi:hypothetical protein
LKTVPDCSSPAAQPKAPTKGRFRCRSLTVTVRKGNGFCRMATAKEWRSVPLLAVRLMRQRLRPIVPRVIQLGIESEGLVELRDRFRVLPFL